MSAHIEVQEWLKEIEKEYNVRILYAAEVGSRGHGLASPDSDYDVRFIYIGRNIDEYVLEKVPGVINVFSPDKTYDLLGYELRRAIKIHRTSSSIIEWLSSKIVYRENHFVSRIAGLKFDGQTSMKTYRGMTGSSRGQLAEYGQRGFPLKQYFYAIRPAAMLQWYMERNGEHETTTREGSSTPPLDFQTLVGEIKLSDEVKRALGELFLIKTTQARNTMIKERVECIDKWIDGVIKSFDSASSSAPDEGRYKDDGSVTKIAEDLILEIIHAYSPV